MAAGINIPSAEGKDAAAYRQGKRPTSKGTHPGLEVRDSCTMDAFPGLFGRWFCEQLVK